MGGKRDPVETGGHIFRWILVCYLNTILVRIRRHGASDQTNEASLRQLLEQIKKRPDVPTQERAIGTQRGPSDHLFASLVARYAERWTGGVVGGPFDLAVVDAAL